MNGRRSLILAAFILIIAAGSVAAQQSFRDTVTQEGFGWLAGRWTATSDQGDEITLSYRWELDGHMVTADFKMGEYAYRSMIFYLPAEEQTIEVGVDNKGGRVKGSWQPQDNTMVARRDHVNAEGEKQKMVTVYSKVDDRTMKVELYGVGQNGDTMPNPFATLDFKRKGRRAGGAQQKGDLGRIQGTWQGTETGDQGGAWTFVIKGNKVEVKGPEPESYVGTMTLNAKKVPKQADFVITKCSLPEYVGKKSLGIYKLQGKKLTLTACEPGVSMRPSTFAGDSNARVFVLTKQ